MQPPSRGLGGDHESLRSALVAFARAVSLENDQLTRGPVGLLPQFVFQQLYNRLQWLTEETAPAALLKSLRVESATRSEAGAQVWAHSLAPYRESPALVRVLRGHSGPVGDCAVSPDGSMLASASWDGTVRLWELRSGVQVALLLDEHAGTSAEACLFSPDGAVVATRYAWGALKVWRADDGEEIGGAWPRDKSDARVDAPTALAISPRGHLLASGHRSGDLRLWDWSTGLAAASLRGHEGLVTACSFAPDGTRIVSASADGTLRVSLVTGAGPAAVLRAPDGAADMVGWVGDGEAVVSAGADHGLRVWPLAVGGSSVSIEDAASKPTCLAIDPEGVRAAVGHDDGSVTLWSAADGRRLATLAGHGGAVACCAFSPSGGWLVTGGEDRSARLWDVAAGAEAQRWDGHTGTVKCCTVTGDERIAVTGSWDGTLRVWGLDSPRAPAGADHHRSGVRRCVFSHESATVATAAEDGSVRVWDAGSGTALLSLPRDPAGASACSLSSGGDLLATPRADGAVVVWRISDGAALARLGESGTAYSAAWFLDDEAVLCVGDHRLATWLWREERVLATAEGDPVSNPLSMRARDLCRVIYEAPGSTLRVWDALTGVDLSALSGYTGAVTDVALSVRGDVVAALSEDDVVRVWDVRNGVMLRAMWAPDEGVKCLGVSPDGESVAFGGGDDCVSLARAGGDGGDVVLDGHRRAVWSCAFSPDGRALVSGDGQGTARLWDVSSGERLADLPALLGGRVVDCGFSADGRLVFARQDRGASLWDLGSRMPLAAVVAPTDVICHAHSGDCARWAFGDAGGGVVVARLRGGEMQAGL